jgi:hypothetical protein
LDSALYDEVIINNAGQEFRLLPVNIQDKNKKSPFAGIKCLNANISTQEIVEIIREGRAG